MNVRPWKPPPKAITPARPVWARAILMQFSTASAPVVTKIAFFGVGPGASRLSFSASSTATPYGVTIRQVWLNASSCCATAACTFGCRWPVLSTAMPLPKSM